MKLFFVSSTAKSKTTEDNTSNWFSNHLTDKPMIDTGLEKICDAGANHYYVNSKQQIIMNTNTEIGFKIELYDVTKGIDKEGKTLDNVNMLKLKTTK